MRVRSCSFAVRATLLGCGFGAAAALAVKPYTIGELLDLRPEPAAAPAPQPKKVAKTK